MSIPLPILAVLCLTAIACASGCKPASEPPRRAAARGVDARAVHTEPDIGAPSGAVIVDAPASAPPAKTLPAATAEAPPTPKQTDSDASAHDDVVQNLAPPESDVVEVADSAADADDGASDDGDGDAGSLISGTLVQLPPELIERVTAEASPRAEGLAKRLNREGLRRHRKLDLAAAKTKYKQALDAWPGHLFSNYNLACAYALEGQHDDALLHLAIIRTIGGEGARERLEKARTDPDFDSMLADPRFQQLTGATPVLVTWSPSVSRRSEAAETARRLRQLKLPAKADTRPWPSDVSTPTIFYRPDDPTAERTATVLRNAAMPAAQKAQGTDSLRMPVVLVLAGEVADQPQSPPPADPSATARATTISEYLGARLSARVGVDVVRLVLKRTGFFSWEHIYQDGRSTRRTGRYRVEGRRIVLDYRQVSETPGASAAKPDVTVEQGLHSSHEYDITGDGLIIDGVTYRPGR